MESLVCGRSLLVSQLKEGMDCAHSVLLLINAVYIRRQGDVGLFARPDRLESEERRKRGQWLGKDGGKENK